MKTIFKHCAVAAFIISTAHSAFAAETADLKVQGSLVMGSCTPTLSSGGVVDYGKISLASLKTDAVNQLGSKEVTLTLTCQSPTKVGWTTMDDRTDTVFDTKPEVNGKTAPLPVDEFGLGKTAGGIALGSYSIVAGNSGEPLVDGEAGQTGFSDDNAATWNKSSTDGSFHRADGARVITFVDTDGAPVAFTVASDVLTIGAAIQNTTTLAITDDTPLDGQATISVKYL